MNQKNLQKSDLNKKKSELNQKIWFLNFLIFIFFQPCLTQNVMWNTRFQPRLRLVQCLAISGKLTKSAFAKKILARFSDLWT